MSSFISFAHFLMGLFFLVNLFKFSIDSGYQPFVRWVDCKFFSHSVSYQVTLSIVSFIYFFFLIFYWIIGFGVHEQSMQDSCVGTHMAVCFAFLLPFTHIWHFSPCYPSPTSLPLLSLPSTPNRPQCVMFPSLCPCVLIYLDFSYATQLSLCITFVYIHGPFLTTNCKSLDRKDYVY